MSKKARSSKKRSKNKGESEKSKSKGEWVILEHRNSKGEPIFPNSKIRSTSMTTYERREKGALLEVFVFSGYKPKSILGVSNKLYSVDKISIQGWRRSIDISVDIEPSRTHERTWFEKMKGMHATIRDPGTPGTTSEECKARVVKTEFNKKIIEIHNDRGQVKELRAYEGRLFLQETIQSVLRREWINYTRSVATIVFTATVSAIVTVLVTIWVASGEPSNDGQTPSSGTEEYFTPSENVEVPAESVGSARDPESGISEEQDIEMVDGEPEVTD